MAGPQTCLNGVDVVVLAGGLGTRTSATLGDTPKLLASIGGTPFLDFLLGRLRHFGARRVILGLGHLADKVAEHLESHPPEGMKIVTVIEPEPLGTAGALRFLGPKIETDPVMVMNGDSFTGADLCGFLDAHQKSGAGASILTAEVEDASAFGRLRLSSENRVEEFLEKDESMTGPGLINAGVYLFSATMLATIQSRKGPSLERDVFQALEPGTLSAVPSGAPFIDIGTPEDLARAADVLKLFMDS